MEKTVIVGMSGGVDSSVSALLLKKQGYNVIGLHMKSANFSMETEDFECAKNVCEKLGIELKVVDYDSDMEKVKEYFASEYAKGRTPNPCVMCNRDVKFKPFLEFAEKMKADYFATGHYARIYHTGNEHILMKAKDEDKDQSYFLNQLSQKQLEKVLFPLGELTKEEVRKIALENGLVNANKKDSFDVCFVGNKKFREYMDKNYPLKKGDIVDIDSNKILGKHEGLNKYTIGQRKGLNIGGQKDILGKWFVVKKDIENNVLYVSTNEEKLFNQTLITNKFNWIIGKSKESEFDCSAKIRYRQDDQKCHVKVLENGNIEVNFEEKQRAISIGQFCVLYDKDVCLGGGEIEEVK
ncbi:MAG: tRNA 2-thiouridine(34) synthase MnmA [Clostridiales bacterium]|nr:tRNA 2-thiouridine(34) synthase MnmA [Candidatus Apopatousia equi]